jgi:hypothetical protein
LDLYREGHTAVGGTPVESTICSLKLWLTRVEKLVFLIGARVLTRGSALRVDWGIFPRP